MADGVFDVSQQVCHGDMLVHHERRARGLKRLTATFVGNERVTRRSVELTSHGFGLNLRRMKALILLVVVGLLQTVIVQAGNLHDIKVKNIDGKESKLGDYKGKVVLIVNVASKCGLTPQYESLEAVYQKYKDKGLVVLGFPCNQFGGQEPGTNEEIKEFCSSKYNVTFPLFDKVDVNGPKRHPLFAALAGPDSPFPGDIKWNFNKFLVSKDGKILKRFEPRTSPDAPEVTAAIESALAQK